MASLSTRKGMLFVVTIAAAATFLWSQAAPDLVISNLDVSNLNTDSQTLALSGSLGVTVRNAGSALTSATFKVLIFDDRNHNGAFDVGSDVIVGTGFLSGGLAAGTERFLAVPLSGTVPFRGSLLYAYVDSDNAVPEISETNNLRNTGQNSQYTAGVGTLNPTVKWKKDSFTFRPDSYQVYVAPVVIDVNGDGTPDILFSTFVCNNCGVNGTLRAIDGKTGAEIWGAAQFVNPIAGIAAGDIDNDGKPEIIAVDDQNYLICFRNDGSLKWRGGIVPSSTSYTLSYPALADLDGDGVPEIIISNAVFNNNGTLRWQGTGGFGVNSYGGIPVVADIDLDGTPEVLIGSKAYRASGQLYWQSNLPDNGFAAVGNFDSDPQAEIVIVASGNVYLLEHDGTKKWGPVAIPGGGFGGAPTVADMDGDGLLDIGVAGATRYVVFNSDGTIKWQMPTVDQSSSSTGSSVFDFDGDGKAEVIYGDEQNLWIFKGSDGSVLYQFPRGNGTAYELPVIADVDGDGHADIVTVANNYSVPGKTGVYVLSDPTWVNTRRIWNQHSYSVTNVNDDGTIPKMALTNWLQPGLNNFRLNTFTQSGQAIAAPDLTSSFIRKNDVSFPSSVQLMARIGNGGSSGIPSIAGLNLIQNGSFEAGSPSCPAAGYKTLSTGSQEINSWLVTSPTIDYISSSFWTAGDGRCSVDLTGTPGAGAIEQSIPTTPGHTYQMNFLLAGNPQGSPTIKEMKLSAAGASKSFSFDVSGKTNTNMGYVQQSWQFVAIDSTTTIRFESLVSSTLFGPVIDKVEALDISASAQTSAPVNVAFYRGDPASGGALIGTTRTSRALNPGEYEDVSITWKNPPSGLIPIIVVADDDGAGRGFINEGDEANNKAGANLLLGLGPFPLVDDLLTRQKDSSADLTWSTISGATGYNIYRRSGQQSPELIKRGQTTTNQTDAGLTNGMVYYYTVRWVNAQGQESGDGTEASATPTKSGTVGENPPTLLSKPVTRATAGTAFSYQTRVTDPDTGDALSYSLPIAPTGMTISASGLLQWSPTATSAGYNRVQVKAQDLHGHFVTQTFQLFIEVQIVNNPPVITSTPITSAATGVVYSYAVKATDPDTGDLLTFSLDAAPAGMSIIPSTGLIQWTPTPSQGSRQQVTVRVRDLGGLFATQTFAVVVSVRNLPPTITSTPPSTVTLQFAAVPNSFVNVSSWSLVNNPLGSSQGPNWAIESGGTVAHQTNNPDVTMWVSDFGFANSRLEGTLLTDNGDDDYIGFAFGFQNDQHYYVFSWAEGSQNAGRVGMGLCAINLPTPIVEDDGVCSSSTSRHRLLFSNAIPYQRHTSYRYTLTYYLNQIQITVKQGNQVIESFAVADSAYPGGKFAFYNYSQADSYYSVTPSVPLQGSFQYPVQATDPNGDPITFSLLSAPSGMTISPTGLIQWTPTVVDIGSRDVTVKAQDPGGLFATQTFSLQVPTPNRVPVISSTPVTVSSVGQSYQYQVLASDADPGDVLTYSLKTAPVGMTINPVTGLIRWTPTGAQNAQVFDVRVIVTDSGGLDPTQSFTVKVGTGQPPIITSTAVTTAVVNAPYSYAVAATDPQSLALTFSLQAAPTAMTINPNTGLIQWSPSVNQIGNQNVTVRVQDTLGLAATQSFTIAVANPAPTTPFVSFSSPLSGALLSSDVSIVGTATDPSLTSWLLEYRVAGTDNWTTLAAGSTSVSNATLATLPVTLIANNPYRLRLTAANLATQKSAEIEVLVNSAQLKLGDFSLAFEDLRIPGLGIPISLRRTYDTKRPESGDFGPGWTLDFSGINIRRDVNYNVFLTLPDGRRVEYMFTPTSPGGPFGFVVDSSYTAQPGVFDTLQNTDCPQLIYGSNMYLCNFEPYDPQNYKLTTKSGYTYTLTASGGIKRIDDRNGNYLIVTSNGITTNTGQNIVFTRDSQGRITQIAEPGGSTGTLRYVYDAKGRLSQFIDQAGSVTKYSYENTQFPIYLTRIDDPLNRPVTRNVYDASGRLSAQCDANGNLSTLAGCVQFSPTVGTKAQTVFNARGYKTDLVLDANGNVLVERRWLDTTNHLDTVRTYDGGNNLLTETDPAGNVNVYTYDTRGNKLTDRDPGGHTNAYTYNSCDKVATKKNASGSTTTYGFDSACNLTQVTDALGGVTKYVYNSRGQRTQFTDSVGNSWTWAYNSSGFLSLLTDPSGKATKSTFGPTGDLLARVDRMNRRIEFTYDADHRLTKETWDNGRITSYNYDAAGELTGGVDPDSALAMTYDSAGRLASIDSSSTPGAPRVVISYTYDATGNVTALTDSLGGTNAYTYDALDHLSRVTQSGTGVQPKRVDMTYDSASLLKQMNRYMDLAGMLDVANTFYSYDCGGCAGRVSGIVHRKSSDNSVIDYFNFTRDGAGDITQISDAEGTHSYTYDGIRRLLAANHASTTLKPNEFYTYNLNGNRLTSHLSSFYSYSATTQADGNRLLQDSQFNYTYDYEGNMTLRTDRVTGETLRFGFDSRNRLVSETRDTSAGVNIGTTLYSYDVINRRLKIVQRDQAVFCGYDGPNPVMTLASNGSIISRRLYTRNIDSVIAEDAGATSWFLKDQIGSVRDLIDNNGAVLEHNVYDSFGRLISQTGIQTSNDIQFAGREFNAETGVGYFRARHYLPTLGRFISQDELSSRDYVYAKNNPLRLIDPFGLETIEYSSISSGARISLNSLSLGAFNSAQQTIASDAILSLAVRAQYLTSGIFRAFAIAAVRLSRCGSAFGNFIPDTPPAIPEDFEECLELLPLYLTYTLLNQ